MNIGDRVFVHGYVDEIRNGTIIIRNRGGYFGTDPSEVICGDLVQCKDCRHRHMEGDCTNYYWCILNNRPIDDTDFCSWAERSDT